MVRRAGWILAVILVAIPAVSCSEDVPVSEPRVPDIVGRVIDVDSPEKVDGGRFVGAFEMTLADSTVLSVPRGARYDGPRCVFVAAGGDMGGTAVSDCAVHAGGSAGETEWVVGLLTEDGRTTIAVATGDVVAVDVDAQYLTTRYGYAFPWRDEPMVDCPSGGTDGAIVESISGPGVVEHGAFGYAFDDEGWLIRLECGYEG